MLQAPLDKYHATLILGILQILGTSSCVLFVHYTGKRPLAFLSTIGSGTCCLLVAGYDVYVRTVSRKQAKSLILDALRLVYKVHINACLLRRAS